MVKTLLSFKRAFLIRIPAASTSLFWERFVEDQRDAMDSLKGVKLWQRPSKLRNESNDQHSELWGSGVSPKGLRAGLLGDAWVLGAAASLAEHEERIKDIFTQKEYSSEGIFELSFYFQGRPYKVSVDDRLPMYEQGTPISVQQQDNGAWWLAILEKGYAKMN